MSGCECTNIISFNLYSIEDIIKNGCYFENINKTLVAVIFIPLEAKGSPPLPY